MMTVHVLHAGDGYTYLTRQVASGDVTRPRGDSLTDYYVHDGNPPGRWVGAGLGGLGVSGQVSERQMRALFGEGRHPDADRLERALVAEGASVAAATKSTQLGRRFPRFAEPEDDPYDTRLRAAFEQFRVDHDRSPEPGVERDLIRWNVARTVLAEREKVPPTDAAVARLLAGRGAGQRQPVAGYDLVFTPVKSVSALWALGDDTVRVQVQQAHEAAWRATVDWLQSEAALTRVGAGGAAQVETRGLVATAFEHLDSRSGDPNLHTHVAVSTKVQGLDGKWRSLDGRVLHALGVAASERYNTLIETELRGRLGVQFVDEQRGRARQPVREVAGIPAELRRAFSTRRAQIEDAYAELITAYRNQHGQEPPKAAQFKFAQQATLATRDVKDELVPLSVRREQWRRRAAAVLGSSQAVDDVVHAALTRGPEVDGVDGAVTVDELARRVLTTLSEQRSVWTVGNVQAEAQRAARTAGAGVPGLDVTGLADALVGEVLGRSVPLAPPDLNPVPAALRRSDGESVYLEHATARYTSLGVLEAENRLMAAAVTLGGLVVDDATVTAAIEQTEAGTGRTLNEGQVALARRFAAGAHVLEAGIGPAGAGKTTAMSAFARAVQLAGGRVLGLAPSAAAAAVLGEELGVGADTLHKLLHAQDQAAGAAAEGREVEVPEHLVVDERTVLLVDEAGMAGTPELDRLLALATSRCAAVRLLGDPAQLQAVGAGGVLRLIDTHVGAAHLEDVHRFTTPGEAAASLRMREGHVDALDFYVDNARTLGGTREALTEELYAAWWADAAAGRESVMIAPTNDDVARLSMRARLDRVTAGMVEAGGVDLHDDSVAGVGDVVVTRLNARSLKVERGTDFVKNGDLWQVVERHDDGALRLRHATHKGFVTVPAEYVAEHVELGYAATVHRVQGITVDAAHYLLTGGATREQLYTGLTRGRHSNKVYVVTDELLEVDLHAQPSPARAVRQSLETILGRTDIAPAAITALEQEYDQASSLARLVPQYEDACARVLDPSREERLTAAVTDALGPDVARNVVADDAWSALRDRLAGHEQAGADVVDLVRAAASQRELGSAQSVAQVLHHRLGPPAAAADHRGLPAWITPAPPGVVAPPPAHAESHEDAPRPPATAVDVDAAAPTAAPAQNRPLGDDVARRRVVAINEVAWAWWTQHTGTAEDWTRDYLTERGLTGTEAVRAPAGWTGLVDELLAAGYTRDDLVEAGVAAVTGRGTLIDRFRDRLVMPVHDQIGDLIAFTARRNPAEPRQDVPKYLNSPATPAYRKSEVLLGLDPAAAERLAAGARPVLVEGAMDVAAVRAVAGDDVVPLAPCGTAVTGEQLDLLRRATGRDLTDLVVAFDPDGPGRAAAARVWSMLDPAEAAAAHTLTLPEATDPAQLVQDHRGAELRAALEHPAPLTYAAVDASLDAANLDHVEGRVAAVRHVAALIAPLPAGAVAQATARLTARIGDRLDPLTVADEMIGAHLDAHTAPESSPVERSGAGAQATTESARTAAPADPAVHAWVQGHADLIAARLDALVDQIRTQPPAWVRHLAPAPVDPIEAERWRAQMRRVVAYRDRYAITSDEPVPAAAARGVQELARVDAVAAAGALHREDPAQHTMGDGDMPTEDLTRERRRTQTSSRLDELVRQARQSGQASNAETLAERARRLAQPRVEPTTPDEPHRGPERGGPQM